MKVLVLDTETGGFKKPIEPVEVAGIYINHWSLDNIEGATLTSNFDEYYKPKREMELGAVSTHHILPSRLKDAPAWDGVRWREDRLRGVEYLVGHNVDFDADVVGATDIPGLRRIDVLALSRLWCPDLDAHRLSAMMYHCFGLTEEVREKLRDAHHALADVHFTIAVMVQLWKKHGQDTIHNWHELWEASERGRVPLRFGFGKYGPKDGERGMLISQFRSERRVNREMASYDSWLRRTEPYSKDKYLLKALDGK